MADPELFGRYRVVRRIGAGAFASVWLAHDDVLEGPVAVKVLADNWAGRVDVRERFLDEARMLRRADSDRVVRVHDIGNAPDGRPYFVMTYADAGTLADRLTAVPMDAAEALWFAVETARGVAVLHRRGIIHRDIKPSNVLLRTGHAGQEVLVSDLGLAKAALAASGMTLAAGTPGYMPPEQAEGFGLTLASDVYALAALTYRLLAGQVPRRADSRGSVLDRASEPVRALSRIRSDLPDGIDAVLSRGLATDPADRFEDARAFERALVALAGHLRVREGVTVGGASTAGGGSPGGSSGGAGAAVLRGSVAGTGQGSRQQWPDGDESGAPTIVLRPGSRRATAAVSGPAERSNRLPAAGASVAPPVTDLSDRPTGTTARRRGAVGTVLGALVLAVVVLGAAAVLVGVVEPGLRDRAVAVARGNRFVDSGPLAVSVPAAWAGEYSTQAPNVRGLPAPSSVLTVSGDPSTLRNPAVGDPGTAITLWSSDVAAAVRSRADRPGCQQQWDPQVTVGGVTGRITRWTGCPSPVGRWDDFLGTQDGRTLFVQVKGARDAAQADAVFRSVQLR